MFKMVPRVAFGLGALAAMQNTASAQTVLASALPSQTVAAPVAGAAIAATMQTPTTLSAAASWFGTAAPAMVDTSPGTPSTPTLVAQIPAAPAAPVNCAGVSPYDNYQCLDAYLGDDFVTRLYNYYRLEWGQAGPPVDPNAPPSRIADWPRTPETTLASSLVVEIRR
jgi:hypothetical protein